jgi:hypothetical protein
MRGFRMGIWLGLLAAPLAAQSPDFDLLDKGVRVRTFDPTGRRVSEVRGIVTAQGGDSLMVRTAAGSSARILLGSRTQVSVAGGRRASTGRGAAIGAGVGAATGALLGVVAGEDECGKSWSDLFCLEREPLALVGAVGLGGLGLVGGLIIGALSTHETWVPVALNIPVRPVIQPSGGRWEFGIRVSF